MKLRFVLLALCLLMFSILSIPTLAQELVEWGDTGLAVEVPDNWDIDDSGDDATLLLSDGNMRIYFWEPYEGDDPEQALVDIAEDEGNSAYDFSDVDNDLEIMGDEAFRLSFESEDISGFIVYFVYDDMLFSLNAVIDDDHLSSSHEDDLLEVIQTIQETDSRSNNNNNNDGDVIESAADEDSSAQDIVDEMVDLGLVEDGGDIILEEDEIDEGVFDFAESYEGGKIAMGAWLSIEAAEDDDDYRFCTLVAQSTTDDPEDDRGTMLISGFDSTGTLLVYEYDIADEDNSAFENFDPGVDTEDENNFLMIVQDDTVSAYVNGELIVDEYELDTAAGDDELFTGFVVGDGCSMTNVWAYSFE